MKNKNYFVNVFINSAFFIKVSVIPPPLELEVVPLEELPLLLFDVEDRR